MSDQSITYSPAAIGHAIKKTNRLRKEKSLREVCIEIGGDNFYWRINNYRKYRKFIELEVFQPIIDRIPQFKEYLDEGQALSEEADKKGAESMLDLLRRLAVERAETIIKNQEQHSDLLREILDRLPPKE